MLDDISGPLSVIGVMFKVQGSPLEQTRAYAPPPSPFVTRHFAPKTLGFSLGLDYREAAMVITAKNSTK